MQGHWCAAIGQVPVLVKGAIRCNQLIVASLTDPPMGQPLHGVNAPETLQRAVAISLATKESEEPGDVMAFILFALPAIGQMIEVINAAL